MKLHFSYPDRNVTPPGTMVEILAHPYYNGRSSIELALFNEHRYAFFFWNKWTQKLIGDDSITSPPALVSLDWHQDLVGPVDTEKAWLRRLNLSNNKDVSLYSWANLRPLNDTHIMAAAYLNIIGDVYLHCRQGSFDDDWIDEHLKDRYGYIHTVRKFKRYDDLEKHLLASDEMNVYFDIDLDFFTLQNPLNGKGKNFTYLKDAKIKEILSAEHPLMTWIFQRMHGFTIAAEPEHTGGLAKSNKYLQLISDIFFKSSLFTNYGEQWNRSCHWKHLPKR